MKSQRETEIPSVFDNVVFDKVRQVRLQPYHNLRQISSRDTCTYTCTGTNW